MGLVTGRPDFMQVVFRLVSTDSLPCALLIGHAGREGNPEGTVFLFLDQGREVAGFQVDSYPLALGWSRAPGPGKGLCGQQAGLPDQSSLYLTTISSNSQT